MSPIKLWLGLWILLPAYCGESVVYHCVEDYLKNFEQQVKESLSFVISYIILQVMTWCQNLCFSQVSNINQPALKELITKVKQIEEALKE